MNQRVTYLVTFTGVVLAGAVTARDNLFVGAAILMFAFIISCPLVQAIHRVYYKVCFFIATLSFNNDPVTAASARAFSDGHETPFEQGKESLSLIGFWLPKSIKWGLLTLATITCTLALLGIRILPEQKSPAIEIINSEKIQSESNFYNLKERFKKLDNRLRKIEDAVGVQEG